MLRNLFRSFFHANSSRQRPIRSRTTLRVEELETRLVPATFTVGLNGLSIEQAVQQANANAAISNIIQFNPTTMAGQTITLTDPLEITKDLQINGLGTGNGGVTLSGGGAGSKEIGFHTIA